MVDSFSNTLGFEKKLIESISYSDSEQFSLWHNQPKTERAFSLLFLVLYWLVMKRETLY